VNRIIIILYKILRKIIIFFGVPLHFSSDGEDFILHKIFSKLKNGYYIDIGSHHPILHSNTFLFYLHGWRGVCVDPLPNLIWKYKFFRGKDKFIPAGFDSKKSNKKLTFYHYANTPDNSTFNKERVIELKNKFSRIPTEEIEVNIVNHDDVMKSFLEINNSSEIHLLNLDVEGFEEKILESFFSSKNFPWVVCVEDLGFLADELNRSNIDSLMKKNGYKLGMKTFLSSVYIYPPIVSRLKSQYVKEWIYSK
jgi:FkbM family methyltransferase